VFGSGRPVGNRGFGSRRPWKASGAGRRRRRRRSGRRKKVKVKNVKESRKKELHLCLKSRDPHLVGGET